MNNHEDLPRPEGNLILTQAALPRDTNAHGNIYAGWVMQHMDLAAALCAEEATRSRVVTVSVGEMDFVSPIKVGSRVEFYTQIKEIGRSSLKVQVDVWAHRYTDAESHKVSDGEFILVAVEEDGRALVIEKN